MRVIRVAIVAAMLGALWNGPPAVAEGTPNDDIPILASGAGSGSGWLSFRVQTNGSRWGWDVLLDGPGTPVGGGAALYHPNGTTVEGPWKFAAAVSGDRVGLEAGTVAGDRFELIVDTNTSQGAILFDNYNGGPQAGMFVGEFAVLIYFAGADRHEWNFRGEPGTVLLGQLEGEGAFLWEDGDFTGPVNVGANDPTFLTPRVAVGASRSIAVGSRLVVHAPIDYWVSCGIKFCSATWPAVDWDGGLAIETPEGPEPCPCRWAELNETTAMGPGTYTFHLNKQSELETILFGVVDPELPS